MAWLRQCVAASALFAGIASCVSAQELPRDAGVRQEATDAVRANDTTSFGTLRHTLEPGQKLWVKGVDGRAVRGRLVSVSENDLVLSRQRRLFRPDEQRTFRSDDIEWVQREDSRWQGYLIGSGIGVAVTALMVSSSDKPERSWQLLFPGPEIVLLGAVAGGLIDARHNEVVYLRGATRITMAPIAAPGRLGLVARISF